MNFAMTAAAAALSLVAFGPAGLQMTTAGYLADQDGMSLYVFDKDGPGTSNCYGGCAKSWPPLMVSGNASAEGDFTLVTRRDGTLQWALDGQPLYYWAGDNKAGDTKGDGVDGTWHLAR